MIGSSNRRDLKRLMKRHKCEMGVFGLSVVQNSFQPLVFSDLKILLMIASCFLKAR